MIDTHIYDYDTYSRDTEDATYACAKSVANIIDNYLRDEILHSGTSIVAKLRRENFRLRAENDVSSVIMKNFNYVDIDNKRISGVSVESVRDIVGPDAFDKFFYAHPLNSQPISPELAVQLQSPSKSVQQCSDIRDAYYPKAVSKLMLKSSVDTLCDLYEHKCYANYLLSHAFGNLAENIYKAKEVAKDSPFDLDGHFDDCIKYLKEKVADFELAPNAQRRVDGVKFEEQKIKRLDLSQFYGENKYADGTDMEFGY
jgi:hypothetical protein